MHTRLLYLESLDATEGPATIVDIQRDEQGRTVLFLDQTVFYPQGGGQPYDQGTITGAAGSFAVEEVRYLDGRVKHIGHLTHGTLTIGDSVTCTVNTARRTLHSRLHSAGHVIDMAVARLLLEWTPGKAYHFPEGAYVEYAGVLPEQRDELLKRIETTCNDLLAQPCATRIAFLPPQEMKQVCCFVPDNLPADKPARVVFYGTFGIPCGGTHATDLTHIGRITIRKLKLEKGMIRVSYAIE